jgi:hypothetical protein
MDHRHDQESRTRGLGTIVRLELGARDR